MDSNVNLLQWVSMMEKFKKSPAHIFRSGESLTFTNQNKRDFYIMHE